MSNRFRLAACAVFVLAFTCGCPFLWAQVPAETPPGGETPVVEDENKTPPGETPPAAPQKHLVVFAQHFAREGKQYFTATGEADYPDRTTLAITLFLRKRRTELSMNTRVTNRRFEISLDSEKKLFPGYYEVRAQFLPHLQQDPDVLDLQTQPPREASFSIRIGSEENIVATRKELIEFYKDALERVKKTYGRMRDLYIQITRTEKFDIATASKEWADMTTSILADYDKDLREYRLKYADYIVPIFPQLHGCIFDMQCSLLDVTGDMSFAVSTDLAKEGAGGKVITHQDVLNNCDKLMSAMFGSVDGQILMEEQEELRDLLLNQLKQLAWFNEFSQTLYKRCLEQKSQGQFNSTLWADNLRNWRERSKGLNDSLQVHKGTEIEKRNPRAMKLLFDMPERLEAMWKLFDSHLVEGKEVASQVDPLRDRLQADIMDLIGTFEFSDEFGPAGRWPGLADLAARDEVRLKAKAAECFVNLNSKDDAVRLMALRILTGMPTDLIIKQLGEGVNYGEPLFRSACLTLLGLHGNATQFDRLCALLPDEKNSEFRSFIVRAIGRIGKEQSVQLIAKTLLNDESEEVRRICADALGEMGFKAGIDALIDALDDKEKSVRTTAHAALMRLTADLEPNLLFFPEASADARKFYIGEIRKWWAEAKQKLQEEQPPK